jgi:hypothetical protein
MVFEIYPISLGGGEEVAIFGCVVEGSDGGCGTVCSCIYLYSI